MTKSLQDKVVIVTGAGRGIGREIALLCASEGAKVVVNDPGVASDGSGTSAAPAEEVVEEIRKHGGTAVANFESVSEAIPASKIVKAATDHFGRLDGVVNNAGILRDRTFAKMDLDDFQLVVDVHLMGSVNVTKAAWSHMRDRGYGRIVFTTSSSGLYGNFGQANYSAAKMALVGLMQTLALEGERHGIRVNCLAPSAATQMTQDLYSDDDLKGLSSDLVSPGIIALVADDAPCRVILLAGAGAFEQAHIIMTQGIFVGRAADAAEQVQAQWGAIGARTGEQVPTSGAAQYHHEVNHPARRAERIGELQ